MKKVFLKKGFTLIELLVVISIISMMSAVILASINNARKKASNINVRNTVNAIRTALELYYDSNGKWPSANDGYMVVDNRDNATWNQFYSKVSPFITGRIADLPYLLNQAGNMSRGYLYMKGSGTNPVQIPMYNGVSGAYLGCIIINEGYYFDALVQGQSFVTLNDGGFDPDGIDIMNGNISINPSIPVASCVVTGLHY